jgi:hypothetical protein
MIKLYTYSTDDIVALRIYLDAVTVWIDALIVKYEIE